MTPLQTAAAQFVARYHANTRLVAEQADWHCAITLVAGDSGETLHLHIVDGRVSAPAAAGGNGLRVTAPAQILLDILELRLNPNQPYLFGELTVAGPEADFMRLDYVAMMLFE